MRWKRGSRSHNLEDRRGQSAGRGRFGGLGRRLPGRQPGAGFPLPVGRGGKLSLTSILLILAFLYFFGADLPLGGSGGGLPLPGGTQVGLPGGGGSAAPPSETSAAEEDLVDFVSFVLDDLQATWAQLEPGYRDAKLVLFRDAVQSACGFAQAAMGPFYCPGDQKVYIDLDFYDDLRARFGAPGDFAQAYVLAHEIGHHVQGLTGIEAEVRRRQQANRSLANELSVRMELQADCYAGVWGHSIERRGILEPGDVEEGLVAAAAIGDDSIQEMQGGRTRPESFTHGTSEQRVAWLRRGLTAGRPDVCDTFSGRI